MRIRRASLVVVVGVAVIAVLVAVAATALAANRQPHCEDFPAALGGGMRAVCGPILDRYLAEGGPDGTLGRPLNEEAATTAPTEEGDGDRVVVFARGAIYLDTRTGTMTVPGVWTAYTP